MASSENWDVSESIDMISCNVEREFPVKTLAGE